MFLEKLVESLMLKRRQLPLHQNLGDRSTCFQVVDPRRNVRSRNHVNSIHGVVLVKPIAATTAPAIMQTTPSINMNCPNADPPGEETHKYNMKAVYAQIASLRVRVRIISDHSFMSFPKELNEHGIREG